MEIAAAGFQAKSARTASRLLRIRIEQKELACAQCALPAQADRGAPIGRSDTQPGRVLRSTGSRRRWCAGCTLRRTLLRCSRTVMVERWRMSSGMGAEPGTRWTVRCMFCSFGALWCATSRMRTWSEPGVDRHDRLRGWDGSVDGVVTHAGRQLVVVCLAGGCWILVLGARAGRRPVAPLRCRMVRRRRLVVGGGGPFVWRTRVGSRLPMSSHDDAVRWGGGTMPWTLTPR